MKYRKIPSAPVIIEAEQLTKELALDCLINQHPGPFGIFISGNFHPGYRKLYSALAIIWNGERHTRADVGDWICKKPDGEIYPCSDDVFKATYETI